jgi:hypothetical protein
MMSSIVGRNKPVRATARNGVSGKHHPNSPEKLPLLLTPLAYMDVSNATSRYALGWPYSGLHQFLNATVDIVMNYKTQ